MGYYYFILLTFYLFSIQIVFGNYEVSSNEESIKVLFANYHKETVIRCWIKIDDDDDRSYLITLYTREYPYELYDGFQYIGEKDNSCSFILYPNHEWFKQNQTAILRKKWKIVEKYECGFLEASPICLREYNVFFNPQSLVEIFTMNGAQTKIMRTAPYTNKTLTIRTSSEKQEIYGCRLALHEIGEVSLWRRLSAKEDYAFFLDIYPSSNTSGIEFIGDQDNSCSFRVNLDFIDELDKRYNGFLNRYWTVQALLRYNGGSTISNYKFYMNSLSWWKNDHIFGCSEQCQSFLNISNVFLTRRAWGAIDVQYY